MAIFRTTSTEKEKLIEISLKEIESACLNQSSVDWPVFAKRTDKIELFLKYFDFKQDRYLSVAAKYIEATELLYGNGQGDVWFLNGDIFAKGIIDKIHMKSKDL
jgi:hypothetical protein